ncbi:MAG: protein-methionine-sulfoxide reductase heme-binding subunit MsrQ [Vicinamibacterales bacterium]
MAARLWRGLGTVLAAIANWRFFKPVVFVACLAPGVLLLWDVYEGDLGVDPVKTLLHETGETALAILLLSLTVTPIRRLFRVTKVQLVRRMLGLWAFFYALVHLSMYLVFDQLCYSLATCDFETIWKDILLRRFIFVGQLAFVILLALALTSTKGWQRRLGRNWTRLHRLVYVAAGAGVVHFIWIQKADISEPLKWACWLLVLLAIRAGYAIRGRLARSRAAVTA